MQPVQRVVICPAQEVAVDRAARRQILWQRSPLAARAENVHEPVEDRADVDRALVAAAFGRWNERLDQRPLLVRQIARVALLATVISTAVLRRPHPGLLRISAQTMESQLIHPTQHVRGWTLTPGQLGAVTSSIAVGALIGALFGGPLIDRIGRLKVFMLDMIFFVVTAVLAAFAPNVWVLLLAMFIMGVGVGIDVPAAFSFLAEYSSVKKKRSTMNRYLMYWYYATIAAFLLALLLYSFGVSTNLWRWLVGFGAVPAVGLMVLRYRYMDESPFWVPSRSDLHKAAAIICKMYGLNVEVIEKTAILRDRTQEMGLKTIFSGPYITRTASVASVNFLQALVYFCVAFYLPVVAAILFGHSYIVGVVGAAGFQIFGLIGATLSSRTVSTIGLRRQAMIGFGIECVALLVLGMWSEQLYLFAATALVAIFMLAHTFGPGQNGMAMAALSYPTEI